MHHIFLVDTRYTFDILHAMTTIKALTVCQPHASAIIRGPKRYENRTWVTSYRGPLLIHAGASRKWYTPITREWYEARGFTYGFGDRSLPLGAFIGIAWLENILPLSFVPEDQRFTACAEGPFCWNVVDPLEFPDTIPAKGALGLFEVSAKEILDIEGMSKWIERHGVKRT